jgi:hypothetical protein
MDGTLQSISHYDGLGRLLRRTAENFPTTRALTGQQPFEAVFSKVEAHWRKVPSCRRLELIEALIRTSDLSAANAHRIPIQRTETST